MATEKCHNGLSDGEKFSRGGYGVIGAEAMLSATCEKWLKVQKRKVGRRRVGEVDWPVRKCEDIEGDLDDGEVSRPASHPNNVACCLFGMRNSVGTQSGASSIALQQQFPVSE